MREREEQLAELETALAEAHDREQGREAQVRGESVRALASSSCMYSADEQVHKKVTTPVSGSTSLAVRITDNQ